MRSDCGLNVSRFDLLMTVFAVQVIKHHKLACVTSVECKAKTSLCAAPSLLSSSLLTWEGQQKSNSSTHDDVASAQCTDATSAISCVLVAGKVGL